MGEHILSVLLLTYGWSLHDIAADEELKNPSSLRKRPSAQPKFSSATQIPPSRSASLRIHASLCRCGGCAEDGARDR